MDDFSLMPRGACLLHWFEQACARSMQEMFRLLATLASAVSAALNAI
jgi:hypothetical protein